MFTQQYPVKIVPKLTAPQQMHINIPATVPADREYVQEMIEQVAGREDSIANAQIAVAPYVRRPLQPTIEVDPVMLPFMTTGCRQPVSFPDTIPTTALQRYLTFVPASDSISVAAEPSPPPPSVKTEIIRPYMPSQARAEGYPYSSVIVILVGLLFLFTCLKYRFGGNLWASIKAFFDYHQTGRMRDEQRELDRQAIFYTNLFSFFVTGVFISLSVPLFQMNLLWDNYFLSSVVGSIVAVLTLYANILTWQCFGSIFLIQPVVKEYVYNMFLFNGVQGLFIFPLLLLIPFVPNSLYMTYVVIAILGLIYLVRILRFFQIIHAKKVPSFYFILYLCTLEFLPFAILVKLYVSMVA
ncbi:MAG: DUF4271 domain-containing protein [Bacteroidales bacterium]|jgi:hypothetical protein|nr:DUF4271 domain-containing protein [Bacteroidales bacterium]